MVPPDETLFNRVLQTAVNSFFYIGFLFVQFFITIGEITKNIVSFPLSVFASKNSITLLTNLIGAIRFVIYHTGHIIILVLSKTFSILFVAIQKTVSVVIWIILLPYRLFIALFSVEFRFFLFGFLICLVVIFFYQTYLFIVNLPSPTNIGKVNFAQSSHLFDRNGKVLYEIYRDQNRTPIKLPELPPYVKYASVAIEDKDFFKHNGVSLSSGILRALKETIATKSLQGGSTITQQLVKSALLSPERTLTRKIKEIILALWTEKLFSKERILEMYLNQVPYGGSSYGVEEAAKTYFGLSSKDLSIAQAALLAGLPQAPSIYSPYINPDLALSRRNEVLKKMKEQGYITKTEEQEAKNTTLEIIPLATSIKAPHFVFYAKKELEDMFGERMVEEGGLNVITSLDLELQYEAENILREELEKIKSLNVSNGAILITKPSTGEILAMVGSVDYFAASTGAFNVTTALRQPGSSIKPLMYALALEKGYTAATVLDDSPVAFTIPGAAPYKPVNYDGVFHGKVPFRYALANSFNITAVRTLNTLGVDAFVNHARKMGITTWDDSSRFGLSLTLGGGEVHMTDMATAFGTFANLGERVRVKGINKVSNTADHLLYDSKSEKAKVIDEGIAYIISDILSDNFARRWAFGANNALEIPGFKVAVKTGTTDEKKDNWTIGYTPRFLVAVWVGNNDNTPMNPYLTSGVTGAAPIWNRVMRTVLTKYAENNTWFARPNDIVEKTCYYGKPEYFVKGTENKASCKETPFGVTPSPTKTP